MSARPSSRSSPLGRWLLPAAVLGVLIVLVGAAAIVRAIVVEPEGPAGARVVVVGDSVTYQSAADLGRAFDWTENVSVEGRPGHRTDELVDLVRRMVVGPPPPDIGVFMTGYNDVWQDVDTSAELGQAVALSGSLPCAVWVLIPTKGDYPSARVETFNERVRSLAARHPRVYVEAGWRDAADDTDDDRPDPDLVSSDLVHPTRAGTAKIAAVMESAVSRHCG